MVTYLDCPEKKFWVLSIESFLDSYGVIFTECLETYKQAIKKAKEECSAWKPVIGVAIVDVEERIAWCLMGKREDFCKQIDRLGCVDWDEE